MRLLGRVLLELAQCFKPIGGPDPQCPSCGMEELPHHPNCPVKGEIR